MLQIDHHCRTTAFHQTRQSVHPLAPFPVTFIEILFLVTLADYGGAYRNIHPCLVAFTLLKPQWQILLAVLLVRLLLGLRRRHGQLLWILVLRSAWEEDRNGCSVFCWDGGQDVGVCCRHCCWAQGKGINGCCWFWFPRWCWAWGPKVLLVLGEIADPQATRNI